jgi:hypothetical protein
MRKQKQKQQKPTAIGKLIRAAGSAGGTALGGYLGIPELGGAAGNQLGALASRWLGFGAYRVSKNSVLKSSMGIPAMHSTSQTVVVRHKEYIGPISSSTTFKVLYELPLNPAMSQTFPWLAGVASRYQEYAFRGVVFHYVPSSGAAISGTSPSLGTVMLQTAYRATEERPIDKIEMLNEYCASEAVPSEPFIHPVECDPKENPFNIHYTRTSSLTTGEPLTSYDLGKTFVAVQGQLATGNVLGDLWVTYEVELKKPVVRTSLSSGGVTAGYWSNPTTTNLFANPTSISNGLDLSFSGNAITVPASQSGAFMVACWLPNNALTAFSWNGTLTVDNCVTLDMLVTGGQYMSSNASATDVRPVWVFRFEKVNDSLPCTITIGGLTWASIPPNRVDVLVTSTA